MKTTDIVITILAVVLVGAVINQFCGALVVWILKFLLGASLIVTVLYWKLMPYRAQMLPKYRDMLDKADIVLGPVCKALSVLPRVQLGNNLWLDLGLAVFASILVLTLIII